MSQSDYFRRNVILLQILSGLKGFVFFFTVIYILFFQVFIDSYSLISLLLIAPIFASLIFQYPTGIFADTYGRVLAIRLGFFSYGISILLFLVSDSFIGFLFALLFFILGHSFISGSEESLLFESLRKNNLEQLFDHYLSRLNIYFVGVGIITNFLSPFLFSINILYPFIVSFIFFVITFILSFMLRESLINDKNKLGVEKRKFKLEFDFKAIIDSFKIPFKIILSKSFFIFILSFSIFFGSLIGVFGDLFNQPLIYDLFGLEVYGILFALATLVQTIIIYFTSKIFSFFKEKIYLFLVLIWVFGLQLTLLLNWYFVIFSMGVMWSVGSLLYILISQKIQHQIIDDSKRASVHSLFSTIGSLGAIIVLFISGLLIDLLSLIVSLIIISSTLILIVILILVFYFFIYKGKVE